MSSRGGVAGKRGRLTRASSVNVGDHAFALGELAGAGADSGVDAFLSFAM
jgi:hypothetical protein